MTAEEEDPNSSPKALSEDKKPFIPKEIAEIFEFLSFNEKIVFKSQQIDDPELDRIEKVEIAKDIFRKNRQTFLQRFGAYFEEQHLDVFGNFASTAIWNEHENGDEISDILLDYKRKIQNRKWDVKNRRYAAMQQLIKQGDYFSELEMMNRAPELYQELVGRYLSEAEIRQRDSYDVRNTTFSGILMHTLEQQQRDAMLKEADAELEKEQRLDMEQASGCSKKLIDRVGSTSTFVVEEDDIELDVTREKTQANINRDSDEYEVPQACRQQWGNFDNENISCSTSRTRKETKTVSRISKKSSSNTFITAGERDLLRQEFVGIMHERFLAGMDKTFDYSLVDDNTQLDDISQLNQDKEDAYFDTSDDDDNAVEEASIPAKYISETESEDELDLYMRHLNQHHSLKS